MRWVYKTNRTNKIRPSGENTFHSHKTVVF